MGWVGEATGVQELPWDWMGPRGNTLPCLLHLFIFGSPRGEIPSAELKKGSVNPNSACPHLHCGFLEGQAGALGPVVGEMWSGETQGRVPISTSYPEGAPSRETLGRGVAREVLGAASRQCGPRAEPHAEAFLLEIGVLVGAIGDLSQGPD